MITLLANQPTGIHILILAAILLTALLSLIERWDRRREGLRERREGFKREFGSREYKLGCKGLMK